MKEYGMRNTRGRLGAVATLALASLLFWSAAQELPPMEVGLDEAVRLSLERNLDLAVSRVNPRLAEQDVTITQAVFDPSFGASASYEDRTQEITSAFSPEGSENFSAGVSFLDRFQWGGLFEARLDYSDDLTIYPQRALDAFDFIPEQQNATLALIYEQSLLRDFGLEVNRTSIEQARNELRISEAQLLSTMMDVVLATERAYWNLLGARRQLEVARGSLELAIDFLEQTKIRVEVGTLPPIEVTTAEAEVASREEGVILAERDLENAEDQLRALIRVEPGSPNWRRPIQPTDQPVFEPRRIDVDEAIERALNARPEIEEAALRVRNNELAERFRRNQTRPDLVARATYSSTGNSFDYFEVQRTELVPVDTDGDGTPDSFIEQTVSDLEPQDLGASEAFAEIPERENSRWTVGLTFNMPIGNRDAKARLARARLAIEQSQLSREALEQEIAVDVRRAVREIEAAARRVASARANLVLQRKRLEAEEKRYENGLSTAYLVLEAQNDLQEAESRRIAALVDYNNAIASLAREQGVLLGDRGIRMQ